MNWSVEKILVTNFTSSDEAERHTDGLRRALGFPAKAPVARMAIGRSLGEKESAPAHPDNSGRVIKGETLFGTDMYQLWVALLVADSSSLFPEGGIGVKNIQDSVARHWHRGVKLLMDDWDEAGEYSKFIDILVTRRAILPDEAPQQIAEREHGHTEQQHYSKTDVKPVKINIGRNINSDEDFIWTVNGVGHSPHIAIMGQVGSGKTITMLETIRQIRQQTDSPVLLFDLGKGELAKDQALAREISASANNIIRVPNDPIPLDMFNGSCGSENSASDAVMSFRDSLEKVMQSRPGSVQLEHIREALKPLFASQKNISLEDMRASLVNYYEENDKRIDSVISTIKDLTERMIFRPSLPPAEFFSQSWIIVFNDATDTVRQLAVYLILDSLNAHMKKLEEAEKDADGNRAIKLVLAIDEARNILASKHKALSENIRLHRSKGLVVTLASQSPDDYDGASDDYLENIGLPLCFKTNAKSTKVLQNMFSDRKVNFASLDTGVCITTKDGKPIKVKAF